MDMIRESITFLYRYKQYKMLNRVTQMPALCTDLHCVSTQLCYQLIANADHGCGICDHVT